MIDLHMFRRTAQVTRSALFFKNLFTDVSTSNKIRGYISQGFIPNAEIIVFHLSPAAITWPAFWKCFLAHTYCLSELGPADSQVHRSQKVIFHGIQCCDTSSCQKDLHYPMIGMVLLNSSRSASRRNLFTFSIA